MKRGERKEDEGMKQREEESEEKEEGSEKQGREEEEVLVRQGARTERLHPVGSNTVRRSGTQAKQWEGHFEPGPVMSRKGNMGTRLSDGSAQPVEGRRRRTGGIRQTLRVARMRRGQEEGSEWNSERGVRGRERGQGGE
ncbi:unnamed protein product [Pleuronectes platessa]|uniref:Uncharacterized protein n=1 Tax=Pleuronectes platessa TaxID=8262 RepID=A0A9N7TW82_PLEPL|nr:unnamed protein product [Pleuronectes platessa]